MTAKPTLTRFVVCVALTAFVTACSVARPLTGSDPESLATQISLGDKIDVQRKDGSHVKFRVSEVSPEALLGENVNVPYADVEQVTIREPNGMAAAIVFLVLIGAVAVWMVKDGVDCGQFLNPCFDEY